jgi:excisionase family DNA binding protein
MKISFDRKADASYIKLSNKKIRKTIPLSDYCNVDVDSEGGIVGTELLLISPSMDDFKLWLDLNKAAKYLNKSPIMIRRWLGEKRIPYYKPGKEYLFIKEDLDKFMLRQKQA